MSHPLFAPPPPPPDVCRVCAGTCINTRWDFDRHKTIVTDCRFCNGTGKTERDAT